MEENELKAIKIIEGARRAVIIRKVIVVLLVLLLASSTITYGIVTLINNYESVINVSVNQMDIDAKSISLSEDITFEDKTTMLAAGVKSYIDNTTYEDIPQEVFTADGNNSTGFYVAYTFYLQSMGYETFDYRFYIEITKASSGIEDAVRISVTEDDEQIIYGAPNKTTNETELVSNVEGVYCENFNSTTKPIDRIYTGIQSGQIIKYTVVIWLEGWDADCNDDVIGGQFAINMNFEVLEDE